MLYGFLTLAACSLTAPPDPAAPPAQALSADQAAPPRQAAPPDPAAPALRTAATLPAGEGWLILQRDARLTDAEVEARWGRGDDPDPALLPARIRWLDKAGAERGALVLDRPLARINPSPLEGVPLSWLLTEDWSAGVGGGNGPVTSVLEIRSGALQRAEAIRADGQRAPIHLLSALQAAWRLDRSASPDVLIAAICVPDAGGDMDTERRRYAFDGRWRVTAEQTDGCDDPAASLRPQPDR